MKMFTRAFNDKRQATNFINESGISKDNIVAFFQENDGTYTLMYYGEN